MGELRHELRENPQGQQANLEWWKKGLVTVQGDQWLRNSRNAFEPLVSYFRNVGGNVGVQDAEELQQRIVGQILRDAADGQAGIEQISEQQRRRVGGELPAK